MDRKRLIVTLLVGVSFFSSRIFAEEPKEHFRKGHRFYLDSKPRQAEIEFHKALALDPNLSDARYYLGSIYFKQSRYEEAIEQCTQALTINPDDLKSLIVLGVCYQQLRLFDQAVDAFSKAIDADQSSAAAHSGLGLVYCAQGKPDPAQQRYNILKKIDADLARDLAETIQRLRSNKE